MQLIIGIDIGTTNCKAVVMNNEGVVLYEERTPYADKTKDTAFTEQKAEDVLEAVLIITSKAAAFAHTKGELNGICFSAAMHSILLIDEAGNPLTNAITWADARSAAQAADLLAKPVSQLIYERTGTPIHPMSPLCKIIWWRETAPDLFGKAYKFISLKEYVWFKLFGEYVIDHSIASATGLFDIYSFDWCSEALAEAGITADQLSKPVPALHPQYLVNEAYSRQLTITASVPFFAGGSDGCMANLGSGVLEQGDAALTIGTSGAIRTTVSKANPDKQQRLFNYVITDNLFITGGPINNGGIALQWFAKNFLDGSFENETDFDWIAAIAAPVPPGANKLIFLPYLLGERAPIWNAGAKGVFFGLTAAHTKDHMLRALVEGICYSLNDVLLSIEDIYGPIEAIYASGGFIHSAFWVQVLADVLGKKIVITNTADASAMGAAFLGMLGAGLIPDLKAIKAFIPAGKEICADGANHALYTGYFKVYKSLYASVKEVYVELDGLG